MNLSVFSCFPQLSTSYLHLRLFLFSQILRTIFVIFVFIGIKTDTLSHFIILSLQMAEILFKYENKSNTKNALEFLSWFKVCLETKFHIAMMFSG